MVCSFFQGCFEKVEEWLDDNKYLLGTIGMVILVVEVGEFVRNNSFLFFPALCLLPTLKTIKRL